MGIFTGNKERQRVNAYRCGQEDSFGGVFFFLMFISKRDRDRDRAGDGQREGDTESKAGSRIWAVSTEPEVGLKPTNCEIMT